MTECDTVLQAVDRSLAEFLDAVPWVMLDVERMGGRASERVRALRDHYRARIAEVLMRNIAVVMADGEVPAQNTPHPMALMLVLAGIEGFALRYHSEGRHKELRSLHPQFIAALRALFPNFVSDDLERPK